MIGGDVDAGFPVNVLVIWVFLILMFFAIWQFLMPDQRPPVPAHRPAPATAAPVR